MQHGVDLLLGGHDHLYFVSKGVAAWDGYVIGSESLGTEQDDGVYVIKSGSDFRDLSDMELVLEDMPEGSVRRKVIKEIKGEWSSCNLMQIFPVTYTFGKGSDGSQRQVPNPPNHLWSCSRDFSRRSRRLCPSRFARQM